MTHASIRAAAISAGICLAVALTSAAEVQAQCATCPTPTVAFAPVVAAPTVVVAPRLGLFDRMRLRRWGVALPATNFVPAFAPVQTVAFAPAMATTQTVGFAPSYVTAFAPTATPHMTAFAPMQRTQVVAYAPTTVFQPAVLSPVETTPACSTCSSGCTTCTVASPCTSCSSCAMSSSAAYVDQAAYASAPASSSGCSSCAASSGTPVYSGTPAGGYSGSSSDPVTPPPQIPEAAESGYVPITPGPEGDTATGASLEAPLLFNPNGDPTASRPTVDIHTAVYRRPATVARASTTAARPVATTPTRKAVDSSSWETVD